MSNTFFSLRVNMILEGLGMSQKQLAEIIGIRPQTFNGYMTSYRDVPVEVVIAVAKYFEISTDYLLGVSDDYKDKKLFPVRTMLAELLTKYEKDIEWLSETVGVPVDILDSYVKYENIMPLPIANKIAKSLDCEIDDLYVWEWV